MDLQLQPPFLFVDHKASKRLGEKVITCDKLRMTTEIYGRLDRPMTEWSDRLRQPEQNGIVRTGEHSSCQLENSYVSLFLIYDIGRTSHLSEIPFTSRSIRKTSGNSSRNCPSLSSTENWLRSNRLISKGVWADLLCVPNW